MEKLEDRVAVVTGAASGIGRGLVERFAAEGMKVVLADVEETALDECVGQLRAAGAEAIGVRTDVSREEEVRRLADRTIEEFGAVHVVCNNAGVEGGALFSDMSAKTWEWVMGVNFWGPLWGCRVFLPLLRQQDEAHIVNTASHAAFASGLPTFHAYVSSKAAMAAMTANLASELEESDPHIGVSLLVPGLVRTRMNDSERNRPADVPATNEDPLRVGIRHDIERATQEVGLDTAEVADLVVDGIRSRRFHLLTHPSLTLSAVEGELAWMRGGERPKPPAEDAVQNRPN
ncbi:SDR family NAD(P)-dependent oxidoreductase [Streptomyces sp. NPDC057257]|uniref:SDR family NAD(P)-dependent oxidoreductase n=1 Tax=Streptomyces sp. NPDC057257 TaxID=3346071 RepID=UPI00363E1FD5